MQSRLLVVDDDPDVRDSLRRALGYAGYAVATAVNGADALASVSRSPVDLIILDVLMPMLARVNALLRRAQPVRDVLGYADLTVDLTARTVTRGGAPLTLTKIEFALLELLLRNAEQVLSYDVILDRVWGYGEAPASNALQVFVGFLRRKLEENGRRRLVHNVRGIGYVLRADP